MRRAAQANWLACPTITIRVFTQPGSGLFENVLAGHLGAKLISNRAPHAHQIFVETKLSNSIVAS